MRAVPGCVGAALLFRAIIDQVLGYRTKSVAVNADGTR